LFYFCLHKTKTLREMVKLLAYFAFIFTQLYFICICQAVIYEDCKTKPFVSFFSHSNHNKKHIRDLYRKYSWCVEYRMCQEDDILTLVGFMEDQCGYKDVLINYIQDPYGMRDEVFSLLSKNWFLFKR
jgi:hypothetical protein